MDSGIIWGVIALVLIVFFCALYGRSQEASSNPSSPSSEVKPSSTASASPAPSAPKVCAHCGEENPPDGVYCETCGYKLP